MPENRVSSGLPGFSQFWTYFSLENVVVTRKPKPVASFTDSPVSGFVPYKGGAPALQAVAAGEVQMSFGTAASVLPMGTQGVVKMIGVTTPKPSEVAPGLPSLAETGLPGFNFTFWFGLYGPAGLPPEIRDKIFAATRKVMADPQIRAKLAANGSEVSLSESPAEFGAWASADGRNALERIVQAGVKLD
jgi:tripartite-type tricarboxylate transporter receptor subunit TctC